MKRILAAAALALAACGPAAQQPPAPPATPEATAPAAVATLGALAIDSAIVRPPLDGQTTGAGFFTVRNSGGGDRLIAASSPATSAIELHTHSHTGAMMRMGGFWLSIVRICTGDVCVRSSIFLPSTALSSGK